jgi:hypothetical protein
VQLVQPRNWSRPYGLEGVTVLNTGSPKDVTLRFMYPGSFSYKIPTWAERLDIIAVGGGGGGESGGLAVTGSGGSASSWSYKTVIRGVDIPYATRYLAGVVATGGAGGKGYQPGFGVVDLFGPYDGYGGENGKKGNDSYVVASGMTTLTSVGGAGGVAQPTVHGEALADLLFNDKNYPGAQIEKGPGNNGNHPGGGGAGGWPGFQAGGSGGDGQVWIRAYGWSGS